MTDEDRRKWELAERVHLRIPYDDTLRLFWEEIRHQKFKPAATKWEKDESGDITVPGKCWFFRWGWTGNTSDDTAERCRGLWNDVFDKDYRWFTDNIGIDFARRHCPGGPKKTRRINL